jgi:hypothetical protein
MPAVALQAIFYPPACSPPEPDPGVPAFPFIIKPS